MAEAVKVFVSYSWGVEEETKIVNELEAQCPRHNIVLIRDEAKMKYNFFAIPTKNPKAAQEEFNAFCVQHRVPTKTKVAGCASNVSGCRMNALRLTALFWI